MCLPPSQLELPAKEYWICFPIFPQYSFACSSSCDGGRHMTQCNYLFGQLFSCSTQKKWVDTTFLRRDKSVLTSAPLIRLCLICIFTLKFQKIGNTHFLVLLWGITMGDFMVIAESNFLDPHWLVCKKGRGHLTKIGQIFCGELLAQNPQGYCLCKNALKK